MRFSLNLLCSVLLVGAVSVVQGASSWSFEDATVSVQGKGAGGGTKDKLVDQKPLSKAVELGPTDTLKVLLTTQEDRKAKRPHQAFLAIRDVESKLETSYPLTVKESGKGKVELTQKDIPLRFLGSAQPLKATIVLGSFGTTKAFDSHVFDLNVKRDQNVPLAATEKLLRYGKLDEIHHVFRADPTSPPKIISLVFTGAVLATVPVLLVTWLALGANVNHISQALESAPLSHVLFFASILGLEGTFFLYYTSWNLFQTLPAVAAIGSVAFLSGSRALSEVQERRLAGMR